MDLQQILSLTRKCIDKYNLIENGDKIAVSCSGGKDSLTLAVALNALKRFYPHQFDIKVVSVDPGFKNINFDDLERFFNELNIIYEGRINTFKPMSYLDRTDVTVIRPLLFIDEIDIKGFANAYPLPVIKSPCPADGNTKREYAKNLMLNLDKENKGAKKSLFNACLMYLDKK